MKKHFLNLLHEIRQNRPFTSILLLIFVVVVVFSHYIVAEDTTTVLNSYSGTSAYSTTNSLYNTTTTSTTTSSGTSSGTTSTSTISGTSSGGSGSSSGDSTSTSGTTNTTNTSDTSGTPSSPTETIQTSTTTPTTTTTTETEAITNTTTTSNPETVPDKSMGLTATPGACGTGRIYIFWYPSSNVAGYVLYRDNLQVYKGLETSFLDTGLMADKSYSYRIYLFNSYGLSSGISLSAKSPKNCESATGTTLETAISPTSAIAPTTTTTTNTPTTTTIISTDEDNIETETKTEIGKETDEIKTTTENTITPEPSDQDTSQETPSNLSDTLEPEEKELLYKDSNEDGISDYDSVHVYNIDPVQPSPTSTYEGKSINASEKILLGFDPAKSELVKVVPEEPELSDAPVLDIYKVKEVGLNEDNKVTLKGTALPNSFVTLYIYSTPIIVTVKTNNDGEWQYTMDEELEDGQHKVYTATVNNTGKIVARSADSLFTKTAEAATLEDIPLFNASEVDEPGLFEGNNLYVLIISIFAILVGFFILIGSLSKKKVDQNPTNPAS